MRPSSPIRRGSLLVIVAGLSAMLATLAVAYLSTLRSRAGENVADLADAQARILFHSACAFILEKQGAAVDGAYPLYPVRWHPDHLRLSGPAEINAAESRDWNAGTTGAILWEPRPGCPTDAWFRITTESPNIFIVTVGVGRTRGLRSVTDTAAVLPQVASALGLPSASAGEFLQLQRSEHREFYRVTYNPAMSPPNWPLGSISLVQRLGLEPAVW